MGFRQPTRRAALGSNKLADEKGLVLIAVLCLLATLVLVGTTAFIVSSTDVKVGGNYKTNQTALQVAMAGAEKARAEYCGLVFNGQLLPSTAGHQESSSRSQSS